MVHQTPEFKTNVSALWFPPSAMTGEVTFIATVVERNDNKGSIWYENLTSLPTFRFWTMKGILLLAVIAVCAYVAQARSVSRVSHY